MFHYQWEPEENLSNAPELLREFKENQRQEELREQKRQQEKKEKSEESTVVTGFDKGLSPEKIIGVNQDNGMLQFLVKYKGADYMELLSNKLLREKCPELIINYYEAHISWDK